MPAFVVSRKARDEGILEEVAVETARVAEEDLFGEGGWGCCFCQYHVLVFPPCLPRGDSAFFCEAWVFMPEGQGGGGVGAAETVEGEGGDVDGWVVWAEDEGSGADGDEEEAALDAEYFRVFFVPVEGDGEVGMWGDDGGGGLGRGEG